MDTKPQSPPENRLAKQAGTPGWEEVLDRVRIAMGSAEYVEIDPARLRPLEGQPREYFNESDLSELSRSIVRVGQFQPGIIRGAQKIGGSDHEILDGERRWRAIVLGRVPIYKAMRVQIDDEAAPFVVASIANFNRAGHTHMEISNAIVRLHNGLDMPMEIIAGMYNISLYWAYALAGLQNLDSKIKGLLDPRLKRKEQLPITAAIQVSKLELPVQAELVQKYLVKKITISGLRREALAIAERTNTRIRKRESKQPARKVQKVERLSAALLRTANELLEVLQEEGTEKALTENLPGAYRAQSSIEQAQEVAGTVQKTIESMREKALRPIMVPQKIVASTPEQRTSAAPDTARKFARYRANMVPSTKKQRAGGETSPVRTPPTSTQRKPDPETAPAVHQLPRTTDAKPAPKGPTLSQQESRWLKGITVNHWDERAGRIVMTEVSLFKYLSLWDKGYLEFQQNEKEKPDHLPSRDQIVELAKRTQA